MMLAATVCHLALGGGSKVDRIDHSQETMEPKSWHDLLMHWMGAMEEEEGWKALA